MQTDNQKWISGSGSSGAAMAQGKDMKAWSLCPCCEGSGILDRFEGVNFKGDEEYSHDQACDICAAHFAEVSEARLAGAAEFRDRCADLLEDIGNYGWNEAIRALPLIAPTRKDGMTMTPPTRPRNIDDDVELICDKAGVEGLLWAVHNYLTDMIEPERGAPDNRRIRRTRDTIAKALTIFEEKS